MKRLSIIVGLLLAILPAHAAITLVCSTTNGGTANTVTAPSAGTVDCTGATQIDINVSSYAVNGAVTPTDSSSNTYGCVAAPPTSANTRNQHCHVDNPTVTSTMTFTAAQTSCFCSITVFGFNNTKVASPLDQTSKSSTTGTTIQAGSVTPSEDNEVIIAGLSFAVSEATHTIDLGFSTPLCSDFLGSNHFGVCGSYLIQTSAAAVNPKYTVASSSDMTASNVTFKSNGAAPTNSNQPFSLMGVAE